MEERAIPAEWKKGEGRSQWPNAPNSNISHDQWPWGRVFAIKLICIYQKPHRRTTISTRPKSEAGNGV